METLLSLQKAQEGELHAAWGWGRTAPPGQTWPEGLFPHSPQEIFSLQLNTRQRLRDESPQG